MSSVFERVALANQTELAVSRSSSGASSGENLAFVGDASQGNCVISICIRLGCAPRAFLGRENAAEHDGNARLRQKRVVS